MGELQNALYGLAIIVGFLAFGAVAYAMAATHGGNPDDSANYPLLNSSIKYYNQTQNFTNELTTSIATSQQTDPSASVGGELGLASAAITKTIAFIFGSLGIFVEIIAGAFSTLATFFGVPAWIPATLITLAALAVGFGIIGIIMRWNP
jgi:uncharacterized membrane protein